MLDLAPTVGSIPLERALARALRGGTVKRDELAAILDRYPHRRGAPALKGLLAAGDPALTRSEAEEQFLYLADRGGLGRPSVNWMVEGLEGIEVDFAWKEHSLVVEIDGFAFHSGRTAFEHDRSRDARLLAAGFRVIRLTWRQITEEPEATLVRVAQALSVGRR